MSEQKRKYRLVMPTIDHAKALDLALRSQMRDCSEKLRKEGEFMSEQTIKAIGEVFQLSQELQLAVQEEIK